MFRPPTLFLVMLSASCAQGSDDVLWRHPQPDSVVYGRESAGDFSLVTVPDGAQEMEVAEFTAPFLQLGRLDAGRADVEVFGRLAAFAVIGDQLLVLDQYQNRVSAFDTTGAVAFSYGERGTGPDAFLSPHALGAAGETIVVIDESWSLRILRVADSGVRETRRLDAGFMAVDACMFPDGRFVVLGAKDAVAGVLHLYSPEGEYEHSFGEIYQTGNRMVRTHFASGRLACAASQRSLVFVGLDYLPEVRAYDADDGSLEWVAHLTGVRPTPIEITKRGGVRLRRQPFDAFGNLTVLDSARLLVDVQGSDEQSFEEMRPYRDIQRYLLRTESGSGYWVGEDSMEIGAVWGAAVVRFTSAPFPQVLVQRAVFP